MVQSRTVNRNQGETNLNGEVVGLIDWLDLVSLVQSMLSETESDHYSSKFFLRPHFHLEGLTVSLRLVTKLPSIKTGTS